MKKWILPAKSINKENIQYEWAAESTACEVCKNMDGTIYESANDIPDRPHPNCKCHIEIIEKETDDPIADPFESYKKQREEEARIKLETEKLLGDTKSLMEEIVEYLRQVDSEEQKIKDFEQIIDIEKLETQDKQKLNQAIEKIEFARYRGEKVKKDLTAITAETTVLKGKVEKAKVLNIPLIVLVKALQVTAGMLKALASVTREMIDVAWKLITSDNDKFLEILAFKILVADRYGTNHAQEHNMPNAFNLYEAASPNLLYNPKYIKKNAKIYASIDELHNYQLEKEIHSRIYSEMGLKDCRVVEFNYNSEISKDIENSNALKEFINYNKEVLINDKKINGVKKLEFKNDDADLFASLHGTNIKDVYIDKNGNFCGTITDFYNFNAGRSSAKGKLGRWLQYYELLNPYYLIIEIKLPKNVWNAI